MNEPAEWMIFLRAILALAFVTALILLFAHWAKKSKWAALRTKPGETPRLQLVQSLPLDAKRRLVIVKCDQKEHLLLLGAEHDLHLSSGKGAHE